MLEFRVFIQKYSHTHTQKKAYLLSTITFQWKANTLLKLINKTLIIIYIKNVIIFKK